MSIVRESRRNSRSAAVSSPTSRSGLEKRMRWNCSRPLRLVLGTQPRSVTMQRLEIEL
jgi:hypothetical protein